MIRCQYCKKTINNKRNAFIADNTLFCSGDCRTWYDYRLERLEELLKNCTVNIRRIESRLKKTKSIKNIEKNNKKLTKAKELMLEYNNRLNKLIRSKNNADELNSIISRIRPTTGQDSPFCS